LRRGGGEAVDFFIYIFYACAGYLNYAEMSMVTKMAGSVEAVNTMLLSMLAGARSAQEIELASLQASFLIRNYLFVLCMLTFIRISVAEPHHSFAATAPLIRLWLLP
jgi:hypothetical protein